MIRLLSLVVGLVVAVFVLSFAVTNRAFVDWGLWPLPATLALPMFVPALVCGFVGFVAGGLVAWASAGRWRRLARRRRNELDRLEQRVSALEPAPPPGVPAGRQLAPASAAPALRS